MHTNNPRTVAGDTTMLPPPVYTPVKENEQVLLSLGITADHIAALPLVVQNGPAFLVLEVRSEEVLPLLRPVSAAMQMLAAQYHLAGYCIFYRNRGKDEDLVVLLYQSLPPEETSGPDRSGGAVVTEVDPVFASAASLACYLYDIAMIKKEVIHLLVRGKDEVKASGPDVPVVVRLQLRDGKILGVVPGSDL